MKQMISKEDVSKAIAGLTTHGKKPTLAAIHAMLNNRGSMSTLVRLKSELEASTRAATDSPEGLKAFRDTWALAVAEGRQQQETQIAELRDSLNALAMENERLEGLLAAAKQRTEELDVARSQCESELNAIRARVHRELDAARRGEAEANTKAAEALRQLATTQAQFASQTASIRAEREQAVLSAHEMEIKLVRALALLEAAGNESAQRRG